MNNITEKEFEKLVDEVLNKIEHKPFIEKIPNSNAYKLEIGNFKGVMGEGLFQELEKKMKEYDKKD